LLFYFEENYFYNVSIKKYQQVFILRFKKPIGSIGNRVRYSDSIVFTVRLMFVKSIVCFMYDALRLSCAALEAFRRLQSFNSQHSCFDLRS